MSASGPSNGSRLLRLDGKVKFALESEQMLWPPSMIVPQRFVCEVALVKMELLKETVPFVVKMEAPKPFGSASPVAPVRGGSLPEIPLSTKLLAIVVLR